MSTDVSCQSPFSIPYLVLMSEQISLKAPCFIPVAIFLNSFLILPSHIPMGVKSSLVGVTILKEVNPEVGLEAE